MTSVAETDVRQNGFIIWGKISPAHYCGSRYRDHFVPAHDKPTRGVWNYDGRDEEFRAGKNWRAAYKSTD
jgi:hypothetical protein